jgi:hypothetical protein
MPATKYSRLKDMVGEMLEKLKTCVDNSKL